MKYKKYFLKSGKYINQPLQLHPKEDAGISLEYRKLILKRLYLCLLSTTATMTTLKFSWLLPKVVKKTEAMNLQNSCSATLLPQQVCSSLLHPLLQFETAFGLGLGNSKNLCNSSSDSLAPLLQQQKPAKHQGLKAFCLLGPF